MLIVQKTMRRWRVSILGNSSLSRNRPLSMNYYKQVKMKRIPPRLFSQISRIRVHSAAQNTLNHDSAPSARGKKNPAESLCQKYAQYASGSPDAYPPQPPVNTRFMKPESVVVVTASALATGNENFTLPPTRLFPPTRICDFSALIF